MTTTKGTTAREIASLYHDEIIKLWHDSRTSGAFTRYERLCYVTKWMAKKLPDINPTRIYLAVEQATTV